MAIHSSQLATHVERYTSCEDELREIYPEHWAEIALDKKLIPLNPSYDTYRTLDQAGSILMVTVRDGETLAGYMIGFIWPHLHYQTVECFTDIFFVRPQYRCGGWTYLKLFRRYHSELEQRNVIRWHVTSKDHKDSGAIMRRMGFRAVETHYSRLV